MKETPDQLRDRAEQTFRLMPPDVLAHLDLEKYIRLDWEAGGHREGGSNARYALRIQHAHVWCGVYGSAVAYNNHRVKISREQAQAYIAGVLTEDLEHHRPPTPLEKIWDDWSGGREDVLNRFSLDYDEFTRLHETLPNRNELYATVAFQEIVAGQKYESGSDTRTFLGYSLRNGWHWWNSNNTSAGKDGTYKYEGNMSYKTITYPTHDEAHAAALEWHNSWYTEDALIVGVTPMAEIIAAFADEEE